jgi:hypothetical protein
MQNLKDLITEASKISYRVAFVECPMISVEILVDKADQRQFENFLMNEADNTFMHADGGSVEY